MESAPLHRNAKHLDPALENYAFLPIYALGGWQVQWYSRGFDGYQQVMGPRGDPTDAEGQVDIYLGQYTLVLTRAFAGRRQLHQVDDALEGQFIAGAFFGVPTEKCVFQVRASFSGGQRGQVSVGLLPDCYSQDTQF